MHAKHLWLKVFDERTWRHDCGLHDVHGVCGQIFQGDGIVGIYVAGVPERNSSTGDACTRALLGLGLFEGVDAIEPDRWAGIRSVTLLVLPDERQVALRLLDREDCPREWQGPGLLGTPMGRDEALAHPRRQEFFEVADFVVLNDGVLRSFVLNSGKRPE